MSLVESDSTLRRRAIEIRGSRLHGHAINCTTIHVRAAKGIWPRKTAENWASEAGVKPRMAKYWIAGTHKVSECGKLALVRVLAE